jgi:hypothetical protein
MNQVSHPSPDPLPPRRPGPREPLPGPRPGPRRPPREPRYTVEGTL